MILMALFNVLLLTAAPNTGLVFPGTAGSYFDTGTLAGSPTQFTIETWICYQSLPTGESAYILSTEEANAGDKGFTLRANKNKINLCASNGSWRNVVGSTSLVPGVWYHIAATCSDTELKVYVNGQLDGTLAITTPIIPSSKPLRVGDSPSWTGRLLAGTLSDLRFWSVVRTEAEIASDMTNSMIGTETGLQANWKMNENTGSTVAETKTLATSIFPESIKWYIPASGVTVSGNPLSILNGKTQMTAAIEPANASQSVLWSVSDPSIATINGFGVLSGHKNGILTVTATTKDGTLLAGTREITVSNQATAVPLKQVFIDFGPNDVNNGNSTTSPDVNGNYWNNMTSAAVSATPMALVNDENGATTFGLNMTTGMSTNGIQNGALLNPNASFLGEFAIPTATQDYFFGGSGGMKVSGLDPTKGYSFKMFGCRDDKEIRITQFALTGANTVVTGIQTSGVNLGGAGVNTNNSGICVSDLVYPNASGEIGIAITKNVSNAYLNAMKIEEYDVTKVTNVNVVSNAISTPDGTTQMLAEILPAEATEKDIVWSVDNAGIATINTEGMLTAHGNGTVTVTATTRDGSNVLGTAQIVVSNQKIPTKRVYIDFGPIDCVSGAATVNPDVNGNYWNNYTGDLKDASMAVVDKTNAASGITLTTLSTFRVNPGAAIMSITNPTVAQLGDLAVGTATQDFFFSENSTPGLKISGLSQNKGYRFYVYGSRTGVDARISKYVFTGAKVTESYLMTTCMNLGGLGVNVNNSSLYTTPVIFADANGDITLQMSSIISNYGYLNILKIDEFDIDVASISIVGENITADRGTSQMSATVLPDNAAVKDVTWSVNDESIATIDANGLLSARKNGTVTVTATTTEVGSAISNSIEITISGQIVTGISKANTSVEVFVKEETISVKGATSVVELFNSTGVKILTRIASVETVINSGNLPKGVYILVVDKKQSFKVVK